MQDVWYADKRDLLKWGVLFRLAKIIEAVRILQVAYYRPSDFGRILLDGQEIDVPQEVIGYFRNLRFVVGINSTIRVTVFDPLFQDRNGYLQTVLRLLSAFEQEKCVVFLDPDNGLEPQTAGLQHVLESEARAIWSTVKTGDMFAFYQHQTNRAGQPWIEPKRIQLAGAITSARKLLA